MNLLENLMRLTTGPYDELSKGPWAHRGKGKNDLTVKT